MDLTTIAAVGAGEAERQQTDLAGLIRLLDAYQWAYKHGGKLNKHWLWAVAERIEPCNQYGRYRSTPVTFANGGDSSPPADVDEHMFNWFYEVNYWPIDYAVKELGWIHPFKDGNGRLMWIVRTRLTDTWDNPEPLPDYFGE